MQNGLIEQADLIAAFQCWSKERSRPMGQVLVERGALTEQDRAMLEGLARRHIEKQGDEAEANRTAGPANFAAGDRMNQAACPDRDEQDLRTGARPWAMVVRAIRAILPSG